MCRPGHFTINDLYPTAAASGGDIESRIRQFLLIAITCLFRRADSTTTRRAAGMRRRWRISRASSQKEGEIQSGDLDMGLPHGFYAAGGNTTFSHYRALAAIGSESAKSGGWGVVLDVAGTKIRWRIITPTGGNRCVSCMPSLAQSGTNLQLGGLSRYSTSENFIRWMIPRGNG